MGNPEDGKQSTKSKLTYSEVLGLLCKHFGEVTTASLIPCSVGETFEIRNRHFDGFVPVRVVKVVDREIHRKQVEWEIRELLGENRDPILPEHAYFYVIEALD